MEPKTPPQLEIPISLRDFMDDILIRDIPPKSERLIGPGRKTINTYANMVSRDVDNNRRRRRAGRHIWCPLWWLDQKVTGDRLYHSEEAEDRAKTRAMRWCANHDGPPPRHIQEKIELFG